MLFLVLGLIRELLGHHLHEIIDLVHEAGLQVLKFVSVCSHIDVALQLRETVVDLACEVVMLILQIGKQLS